jgi:hypothetical protein
VLLLGPHRHPLAHLPQRANTEVAKSGDAARAPASVDSNARPPHPHPPPLLVLRRTGKRLNEA